MPGIAKVQVHEARDLPVMDSSTQLTDAYVEIKFNTVSKKTHIAKKTLNPVWNEDFRLEVDDEAIQDEVLEINVWDHDRIGTDDVIGQVIIDLMPLGPYNGSQISGWFPIYDTLKGVRGSLAVTVKLDLFKNHHKYRDTSVGVTFFSTMAVPQCFKIVAVRGLVEELIVNDDPEYQWIDRVRPTRQSNQARQHVFSTVTGELQRRVGVKAIEMKANAVIGYRQLFDLEGDSGLVARGIGTAAVVLEVTAPDTNAASLRQLQALSVGSHSPDMRRRLSPHPPPQQQQQQQQQQPHEQHEQQPVAAQPHAGPQGAQPHVPQQSSTSGVERFTSVTAPGSDIPLITLCSLPDSFLVSVGGVVTARAVKLLDKMENPDETDTRDVWWSELRTEIAGHAQGLGYSAVVGYSETASICDNLCLLSATGTAAILNTDFRRGVALGLPTNLTAGSRRRLSSTESPLPSNVAPTPTAEAELRHRQQKHHPHQGGSGSTPSLNVSAGPSAEATFEETHLPDHPPCSVYHLPPTMSVDAYADSCETCEICHSAQVPEILFTTIDPPEDVPLLSCATFVQARVCRLRRKTHGSYDAAAELGEGLPFLEYALHQQLYNKIKVLAMNALFNLRVELTIGTNMCVAVATATAMHLACLPFPPELQILRKPMGVGREDVEVLNKMTSISHKLAENRAAIQREKAKDPYKHFAVTAAPEVPPNARLGTGVPPASGRTAVVEVDDAVDTDDVASLWDVELPEGVFVSSTGVVPGLEFTHGFTPSRIVDQIFSITKTTINPKAPLNHQLASMFDRLLTTICFKMRRHRPCFIANLRWSVTLPEGYDVQVLVTASIIKLQSLRERQLSQTSAEMGLSLDEDKHSLSLRPEYTRDALRRVVVTSLNEVPCARTLQHLGPVIMYLIKETTSLRDAGGVSSFVQLFIQEVLAMARAHVRSRGGNALVGCRVKHLDIVDNSQKNQGQCLIALQGDAVLTEAVEEEDKTDADAAFERLAASSALSDALAGTEHQQRPEEEHEDKRKRDEDEVAVVVENPNGEKRQQAAAAVDKPEKTASGGVRLPTDAGDTGQHPHEEDKDEVGTEGAKRKGKVEGALEDKQGSRGVLHLHSSGTTTSDGETFETIV